MSKHGVLPDPEQIKVMIDWPVLVDVKGLRKFLGLAAYLHKYSRNYAEMTVHLSRLRTRSGHGTLIVSVHLMVSCRA